MHIKNLHVHLLYVQKLFQKPRKISDSTYFLYQHQCFQRHFRPHRVADISFRNALKFKFHTFLKDLKKVACLFPLRLTKYTPKNFQGRINISKINWKITYGLLNTSKGVFLFLFESRSIGPKINVTLICTLLLLFSRIVWFDIVSMQEKQYSIFFEDHLV